MKPTIAARDSGTLPVQYVAICPKEIPEKQSIDHAGYQQGEAGYGDLQGFSLIIDHSVAPLHGAHSGFGMAYTSVFEIFSRSQNRLLTNHPVSANLADFFCAVGVYPVTGKELNPAAS